MSKKYPHLKNNESNFPNIDDVNVYQFDNDFDYSRFNAEQMTVTVCAVPWDMGEAHIGNRTISGIGNVVYFGSEAKRNAYFDNLKEGEFYRFTTKYKELHRDNYIMLPLPFDVAAQYNYIEVKYNYFANDNSLIEYENKDGINRWYWFIREVEYIAPNTCKVHLLNDAWQTFIYRISISSMILERGHAPMLDMDATKYLTNPIQNCEGLLAEDANYGDADIVTETKSLIFNSSNMYCVCITSANPASTLWGNKTNNTWRTPANAVYNTQGAPSYYAFTFAASNFNAFMRALDSNTDNLAPLKATIKALFFVSSDFITLGDSLTIAGIACNFVNSTYSTNTLHTLSIDDFGYDSKYKNIAKLYTSPYSHLEITDENGNTDIVKIENTSGNISVFSCLSLLYPFVTLSAHLGGIGKAQQRNITFANITNRNMPIMGNWYKTLKEWNIPTYGVIIDGKTYNDYATHYDREQAKIAYTNSYDSAIASATAAQNNANASATMGQTNTNALADTQVTNAAAQQTYNTAATARSNENATNQTLALVQSNISQTDLGNSYATDTTNNEIDAALASTSISNTQGMVSGGLTGALTGMQSGAMAGPQGAAIGAIGGAIGGLVGAGINAHFANAQTGIAANLSSSQLLAHIHYNNSNSLLSNTLSQLATTNDRLCNSDLTTLNNTLIDATAANNAATAKGNATRTYNTQTANAERTYNMQAANAGRARNTEQNAITNQINQAGLNIPIESGLFSNGNNAVTRPIGLFSNVVTQSKDAIARAGDEFLRYGYRYNKQYNFDGNWCRGKYFTYWKLLDFWIDGLNVPDMYVDKIRFFLYGGVTVWSSPENIGRVTIYEN